MTSFLLLLIYTFISPLLPKPTLCLPNLSEPISLHLLIQPANVFSALHQPGEEIVIIQHHVLQGEARLQFGVLGCVVKGEGHGEVVAVVVVAQEGLDLFTF